MKDMFDSFENFGDIDMDMDESIDIDDTIAVENEITQAQDLTPSLGDDLIFDFGSLGLGASVISGNIGLNVSRYAVDKMKFEANRKYLLSIVTNQVVAVKTHYNQDLGSYLCLGEGSECCNLDGYARIKYLFPVVVYDTDSRGKVISKNIDYKVLAVGKDTYNALCDINETSGLANVDLLVTCTDAQYQKLQVLPASPTLWKRNEGLKREVLEFWTKNMKEMIKPIAKKVTLEEVKRVVNGVGEEAPGARPNIADADFNDIFGD